MFFFAGFNLFLLVNGLNSKNSVEKNQSKQHVDSIKKADRCRYVKLK